MNEPMKKARVRDSYVPTYVEPIRFSEGEILTVGHRDQQWQAYLWCTAQDGSQGWAPETYLELTGKHEAVAKRDYNGTELTVARNQLVDVLDEEGGWYWCRTEGGMAGWLPGDVLDRA